MTKATGFQTHARQDPGKRPVSERILDFKEIIVPLDEEAILNQTRRCMDCGVPTCHGFGCPLNNRMPEFHELVRKGLWKEACDNLHSTNNFPEFTGRICPAPCEAACTLAINDSPVSIQHIEYQIAERGFAEGWIEPLPPFEKTGKRVAVVGSGPTGLAAAQQLARAGHQVVVFEKHDKAGGLLRYGIPDFKLDKSIIDRRLRQLVAEGIEFQTGVDVGHDISGRYLLRMFDAILLAKGATIPRDLDVPGRSEADNIHFAVDYLSQQNRLVAGEIIDPKKKITAKDKIVVVIGGGDTGSDCVGTAIRQGAKEVHQYEILDKPSESADALTTWPLWPNTLRTSTSHEEGCTRAWNTATTGFTVKNGQATELKAQRVEWAEGTMKQIADSEFTQPVDLVLLACGFKHVAHTGLVDQLGIDVDNRGNIATADYQTSIAGVFAAGDAATGASLIVRAIDAGRKAAMEIDQRIR